MTRENMPGENTPGLASVLVAMSGGVDSSVAASLLQDAGYEVIGVTMKMHDTPEARGTKAGCCTVEDADDARAVAAKLGIPHYVLDLSEPFTDRVMAPFAADYAAGRTPNPCVECNRYIKFDELLRRADTLGVDFVATGHYARLENGVLRRGRDADKDQSYVLACLDPDLTRRVLFPVGGLHKAQVRAEAALLGLRTAQKPESMEVCFLGTGGKDAYLRTRLALRPGPVLDEQGQAIGEHEGAPLYTLGQRRGLGVAAGKPVYVRAVDPVRNLVHVGTVPPRATGFKGEQLVWFGEPFFLSSGASSQASSGASSGGEDRLECQVQYSAHGKTFPAFLHIARATKETGRKTGAGTPTEAVSEEFVADVVFREAVPAPASGQLAAFYDGDRVLGSVVIRTVQLV